MIKILIVEDSQTQKLLLEHIFNSEPDMKVIGWAKNGKEAIDLVPKLLPDIITMDIFMPFIDGVEATQQIMRTHPTPIVVITSKTSDTSVNISFRALEAGALTVLEKPTNHQFDAIRHRLVETIRNMAEIKLIRRRFFKKKESPLKQVPITNFSIKRHFNLIAMGASVGGPQAIKTILMPLPKDFPIPIVIVQHMTIGFISGFVDWLNQAVDINIKLAEENELLKAGNVYFAPDNYHLEVMNTHLGFIAKKVNKPPVSGFCPSITVLFQSVAKVCAEKGLGILLTGMGNDGALGLLSIKNANGHTLIQDETSAVVFGMGGVAQQMGAVDNVIELNNISSYLIKNVRPS